MSVTDISIVSPGMTPLTDKAHEFALALTNEELLVVRLALNAYAQSQWERARADASPADERNRAAKRSELADDVLERLPRVERKAA